MYRDLPDRFLDLLDIAAYVYSADQATRRRGSRVDEFEPNWRRDFTFHVPVRDPDFWMTRSTVSTLSSALSFASDDDYRFKFVSLRKEQPLQPSLDFDSTMYDGLVEEVVMFSGGLDSLAGAVQESVLGRRRVLLVNHRSTPKVSNRYKDLLAGLKRHAGDASPLNIYVRVNKDSDLGNEYTQRTRSFLFAAIGSLFAAMIGLDRLRFYENGVVSLNLPMSAQVVGARASRTTHPRVLSEYSEILSAVAGRPFRIENPFLWRTKTDMVRLVAQAGCAELIRLSSSCAHTWAQTIEHPHCGDCSQCIDRRFAVLAAGQEEHDPRMGYGVDLLTGQRSDGVSRGLLSAYLETANQVGRMSPTQFFGKFGEAARVFRHIDGRADVAANNIYDLYQRHARDVNAVVDHAIADNATAIRQRELPPSCLVRLVSDSGERPDRLDNPSATAFDPRPPFEVTDYTFRKWDSVWLLRFAGGSNIVLRPSIGAAYLNILLSRPNSPISAVDLFCKVSRRSQDFAIESKGKRADGDAVAAYMARLSELKADREKATKDNDTVVLEELDKEYQEIEKEIRRVVTPKGRIRREVGISEKIRKSVGIAIRRAVADIRRYVGTEAADHIKSRIRGGQRVMYTATQGIEWQT
ncbi:7-cyano-7-deazaguanine synthase [Fimbriiglobus ruber]|nr:7-cyano-7-deazaguanine synthase [Fimbriiglobus ruber]